MHPNRIPFWKASPFCRLLLPLIIGIIVQWYLQFSLSFIIICLACFITAFCLVYFIVIEIRFKLQWLQGILLQLVITFFGLLLVWQKDIRHAANWYGNYYNDSSSLIISINGPVIEKERSYKADAYVEAVVNDNKIIPTVGKLLVYFSKDTTGNILHYGNRILISKALQPIKNSGNPGGFNYERYAAFQQIFHNVYLQSNDWHLLEGKNINAFRAFIFSMQSFIVTTLKKYTSGGRDEQGIAEALLIGYKEDLDKDLVQAYSNAGVVHIIAISGLHLGLIYVMLAWILDRLPLIKKSKHIKLILLLSSLWLFSVLTGASGSVLRSAVMFTFIVIGKNYFRQSSIYNSLAGSAFLLLCYDPCFLWDVGFQLSYLALIGIVTLQQPFNKLFYIKQRWLRKLWEMMSVTVAAQIATFPLCIYYFHQFPNLFFITNLIAVPLSTIILFVEIVLIAVSGINIVALYTGKLVGVMVGLMNRIITTINGLSFSLWDRIYANMYTTWVLYLFIIGICVWLLQKNKRALQFSIGCLLVFTGLQLYASIKLDRQVKLIVYNIPKCRAIDFIYRNQYYFVGDSILQEDGMLQNFHLKPARIALQLNQIKPVIPGLFIENNYYNFFGRKIMLVDTVFAYELTTAKIDIDVLIISKNPSLKISGIANAIRPSVIIFDSSNSLWKIAKWKKECLALDLHCFSIPEQGAFVLNIDQQ